MKLLCIGKILGAQGIRGDLMVQSLTDLPDDFLDYAPYYASDGVTQIPIVFKEATLKGFVFTMSGVADRDAAGALKGIKLYVPRSVLKSLPEDTFYHEDLVGLQLRALDGAIIGRCSAVHNHGAGTYLEGVTEDTPPKTLTLPFTEDAVPELYVQEGYIVVDPTFILR